MFLHSRNISTYKKTRRKDRFIEAEEIFFEKRTKKLAYASFFIFDCVRRGISHDPSAHFAQKTRFIVFVV